MSTPSKDKVHVRSKVLIGRGVHLCGKCNLPGHNTRTCTFKLPDHPLFHSKLKQKTLRHKANEQAKAHLLEHTPELDATNDPVMRAANRRIKKVYALGRNRHTKPSEAPVLATVERPVEKPITAPALDGLRLERRRERYKLDF